MCAYIRDQNRLREMKNMNFQKPYWSLLFLSDH